MSPHAQASLSRRHLLVDGKPVFLRGGELQYFRLPEECWQERLAQTVQANMNAVAFYIPWSWHEHEPGVFDFDGATHPRRNLRRWLDLVAEAGLYAFVRPGPFVNAEMPQGGHPDWLFTQHPECIGRRADGTPAFWFAQGTIAPNQLHPTFLAFVDRWYDAVCAVLRDYLVTGGGPVIMAQPDNEMNLVFTYGIEGSLFDEVSVGNGETPGLWQEYLRTHVGSLDEVSARYETTFRKWADVAPPTKRPASLPERRLVLDWLRFKQWYIFHYAERLAQNMWSKGLAVPMSCNEPVNGAFGSGDHGAWGSYFAGKDLPIFSTGHTYLYSGEQDLLGLPGTISRLEMIRLAGAPGPLVSAELGIAWFDLSRHRAPYNLDLLMRTLIGHGLDGYFFYVWAGGNGPDGLSKYGSIYYPTAPIGSHGELHSTYHIAAAIGNFAASWEQELLATEKVCDVRVGIFSELPMLTQYGESRSQLRVAADNAAGSAVVQDDLPALSFNSWRAVTQSLTHLNITWEYAYLNRPADIPQDGTWLLVPNPGALPAATLAALPAAIEAGARVAFAPLLPVADVDGYDQPALLQYVGGSVKSVLAPGGRQPGHLPFHLVSGLGCTDVPVTGPVFILNPPPDAEVLLTVAGEPCAFRVRRGAGEVLVCGFVWSFFTAETQALMNALLRGVMCIAPVVESANGTLHTVLRSSPTGPHLLTVLNALGDELPTKVVVRLGDERLVLPQLGDLALRPKEGRFLWLDLPVAGAVMCYCTSELLPPAGWPVGDRAPVKFQAMGSLGTEGEIAFDRPVRLAVNGVPAELTRTAAGLYAARYHHAPGLEIAVMAEA